MLKESTFSIPTYRGDARGALWHRWDLHVHTPASVEAGFGDGQQQATWDKYIAALSQLPPEIRAIGINDYFSIDGYRRIRQAKQEGQLPNLELILPVIELRLLDFVGSGELNKLNFHVLFSDEVTPDEIDQLFLRHLNVELRLDDGPPWCGCIGTREGLLALGKAVKRATPDRVRSGHSELHVGFANAAIETQSVLSALNSSAFRDRFLTALGVAEWDQMRWEGAGAAHKRDAINRVHFVFTATQSLGQYESRRAKLKKAKVNDRLVDASDAHYFADSTQPNRLGETTTWIKSDLTFQGLRRAIRRFDDRVFVGVIPPKLEQVRSAKTKYIDRICISKKPGSKLSEDWFNADIPLNHGLVAIIGNQGSGKSALTDVLALCGHSTTTAYSFLTRSKFRSEKPKRAGEFVARLSWLDGAPAEEIALDKDIPSPAVERVRYVPQGFFESSSCQEVWKCAVRRRVMLG